MIRRTGAIVILAVGLFTHPLSSQQVALDEIQVRAADGVVLHGVESIHEDGAARAILLLFHQGAHNARAEYAPLVPRLIAAGFDVVAMDLRRGGSRFGGTNRTVEGLGDLEFSYCDAYQDLEATLAYATDRARALGGRRPIVAWGSSFSAALVLKLAALHGSEISRVLAFSPASGEPMAGCDPSETSADIGVPALVLRPASEMEIPRVAEQLDSFEAMGFATYVADPGVHGSSMLNAERVGASTDATWAVVFEFLSEIH